MNSEWAIEQLTEFVRLTESKNGSSGMVITFRSYSIHDRNDVLAQWVVVEPILAECYPNWRDDHAVDDSYEFGHQRDAALQAIAKLRRAEEIAANMEPTAPSLSANSLHPVIWNAITALWDDGHYRAALQKAGTALEGHIQDKINVYDSSGKDLAGKAFAISGATLEFPRLKVPPQKTTQTTTSYQEGATHISMTSVQLIRNVMSHTLAELDEQEALEMLAVYSLTARVVDACSVIDAPA